MKSPCGLVLSVFSFAILVIAGCSNGSSGGSSGSPGGFRHFSGVPAPGTCAIVSNLSLTSVSLGWGGSGGEGSGSISCAPGSGLVESIPIHVKIWGFGVGIGVMKVGLTIRSDDIDVANHPRQLLGGYAMVRAGVENGSRGSHSMVNFKATKNSLVVPFQVSVDDGSGLELAAQIGGIEFWE